MPGFFYLRPSARLQRFLGRELIADPNLAIIEFVKNAYDAGASEVRVEFRIEGRSKDRQDIRITDNGVGMDRDSFEADWMHPGYSYKAENEPTEGLNANEEAERRRQARVPTGEKGLGRLAAGRLGDVLHVFTRKRLADDWLHVKFDWKLFADMNKSLEEVPIEYDFDHPPSKSPYDIGTRVLIGELTIDWRGKVPGRKVRGRSDIRLGRLREDLMILTQPLSPVRRDFAVYLEIDSADPELQQFAGEVKAGALSDLDYTCEFAVSDAPDGVHVKRTITRTEEIAELTGGDRVTEEHLVVTGDRPDQDPAAARPAELLCGPFRGVFVYSVRRLSAERAGALGVPPGIFLYRDGVRVDPYGHHEDDWLGAYARKAAHQGHAAVQPTQLQGYIEISKAKNSTLVDMSNRQGIVEDEPFANFVAHARAELWRFETLLLDEFQEERWRLSQESKAQLSARSRVEYGIALTRSFIHDLRQPLAALGTANTSLGILAEAAGASAPLRAKLLGLQDRSQGYLREMETILSNAMRMSSEAPVENISTFPLQDAVSGAVSEVRRYMPELEVELDIGQHVDVTSDRTILERAIRLVLTNAAEAPRPDYRRGAWAKVTVVKTADAHEVHISDNGTGIDSSIRDGLFETNNSTKGRPGAGLMTTQQMLRVFGASCCVLTSGPLGTTFAIRIPSKLELPK